MTKKERTWDGVPIRDGLIHRLSPTAREGLEVQLFAWPGDPLGDDQLLEVVSKGMTAAREILRLYEWRPDPPDDHEDRWAWRTVRHDHAAWRPIGPDWEPDPTAEYLVCEPSLDPAPFAPDLRRAAFDLLYWLAAMRGARGAAAAAVAAWRAADARAELWTELEKGWVIRTGTLHRYEVAEAGGRGNKRRYCNDHAAWAEADRRLEGEGVASGRERARRLAGSKGSMFRNVSADYFRTKVAQLRKEARG